MWLPRFRGLFLEEQYGELLYLFTQERTLGKNAVSISIEAVGVYWGLL